MTRGALDDGLPSSDPSVGPASSIAASLAGLAAGVPKGQPVRMCVGCRERAPAPQLVRVVARGTATGWFLQPDPQRRLSGRGAHLHPDPACLAQAVRRRAFGRALRIAGVPDTGPLAEHLRTVGVPPGTTDGASRHGAPETSKVGRPT